MAHGEGVISPIGKDRIGEDRKEGRTRDEIERWSEREGKRERKKERELERNNRGLG